MTTYYVGPGGNNGNAGTSWGARKLTLNGAEDIPVAAGDTVYVGPGVYRESLTVDVSGAGGSPITFIGDYLGANTDGVGGVVRITGSDDDQSATRSTCTSANAKNYRTFSGFVLDSCTNASAVIALSNGCTNWTLEELFFNSSQGILLNVAGSGQANNTIQDCFFFGGPSQSIRFTHTATVSDTANLVQRCIFNGNANAPGVDSVRVGGVTVKNCLFNGGLYGVRVSTALAGGQVMTVNNCLIQACATALAATTTAEFSEDFNNLWGNQTDRTNVTAGSNSLARPILFDPRWFFQMVNMGAGPGNLRQLLTPFDLFSASQLLNVAGTSPPSTDMRGTAVQGAQREWGPLEYDSSLKILPTSPRARYLMGIG